MPDEYQPDVVVTDLQLPDGTGLDIVRSIRQRAPGIGLVMLTMHSGDDQIFAAMEAGASGFVGKDARPPSGARRAPCPGLAADVRVQRPRGRDDAPGDRRAARLSEREQEVLVLLADGLGTAPSASELYMSESTVKSHIAPHLPEAGRQQPRPGTRHRDEARAADQRAARLRSVGR